MRPTREILRDLPYFADLEDELLDEVSRQATQQTLPAGSQIIEEGSTSDDMFVIVSGQLEVAKKGPSRDHIVLATLGPGDVVGEIALLDGAPRTASVLARTEAEVVRIPGEAFEELLGDSRVVRRMFRTVTSRLRGIEETLRHEERMSALGRMAAQLMHELNNPAAAVGRTAKALREAHQELGDVAVQLAASDAEFTGRIFSPHKPEHLDPLTRSELEEQVTAWFESRGDTDHGWQVAPALVLEGWTPELIGEATEGLDDSAATTLARWLGLRCLSAQLIDELGIAADRVSDLVRIVKEYSFLDRAPVQEINPVQGIRDTLVLLKHKLTNIEVVTDIDPGLSTIEAPGRDLNQVWTNLIDNAADAMSEGGVLTISAANIDQGVRISINNTGQGIDPDVLPRIFDPFFTTKEPGKGTGLGLHTVHTIVTRAGGTIDVTSNDRGTTFVVRFPAAGEGSGPSEG